MQLPGWLWGNDVFGFAEAASLHREPHDVPNLEWAVQTGESYEARAPTLFALHKVVGPGQPPDWGAVEAWPAQPKQEPNVRQLVAEETRRLADLAEKGDLASFGAFIQLNIVSADQGELGKTVQGAFESLGMVRTDEGPVFPERSAYLLRVADALGTRAALARVLLRVEEEPALLMAKPTPAEGEMMFASGSNLMSDIALSRGAYFDPLFLCLSPYVWAFRGARQPGLVIFDLGTAISGRRGEAAELLQLFHSDSRVTRVKRPMITPNNTSATLRWWVDKMNEFWGVISDPAMFVDPTGQFRPRRQFEALLGFEQIGKRIQAVLSHDRDMGTRRALSFAALDTLEGLVGISFETACTLRRAEKALAALKAALPVGCCPDTAADG